MNGVVFGNMAQAVGTHLDALKMNGIMIHILVAQKNWVNQRFVKNMKSSSLIKVVFAIVGLFMLFFCLFYRNKALEMQKNLDEYKARLDSVVKENKDLKLENKRYNYLLSDFRGRQIDSLKLTKKSIGK